MLKYLLLLLVLIGVWWFWRQSVLKEGARRSTPLPPPPERMVACAHCGVNQPLSESLCVEGRYFCSEVHRRAAQADATPPRD